MNKKILLVICALFFFFVNINVLAEDEYCCDGKVWDGESSCNSKGVKNGSCTKTVAISSSSTPQKLSYGESVTISNCGNSCTISSNFGDIVSATGSSVSVVKNPPNCIKEGTVSFSRNPSYSNGVKTTYTSLTLKFKAVAVWGSNPESNKVIWSRNNPTPTSKEQANSEDKNIAYVGCRQDEKNKYKWTCDKIWKRGCNVSKKEEPGCYKESSTGFYYWGFYDGKTGYDYVSSITDYKNCVSKFQCSTKYPSKAENTTPCNGTGQLGGTYTKKCDSIYEIKCEEKVKTKFNGPVYDSSLNEINNVYLYPGTGFKYNLGVSSKLSCTGTFDNNRYAQVENYIKNYANAISGATTGSIDDELFVTNALSGLEQIKKSYTDWNPNYIANANANIKDEYKGKTFTSVKLVSKGDSSSTLVGTCGKLPNGQTVNFTYQEDHALEKEMPMAYLTFDGKVKYATSGSVPCTNCEKLGKKFFISDNRELIGKNNYYYIVNVDSLGYGKYGSDSTKCSIYVLDNALYYRHIDLGDPFLTKSQGREPGYNWSNNRYNFTKIIKTGVWSDDSEYNAIDLDPETNRKIKTETSGNTSYYVGACARGSAKLEDKICELLRNSKK